MIIQEDGKTCDTSKTSMMNSKLNLYLYETLNEEGSSWKNEALPVGEWTNNDVVLIATVDDEIKDIITKITFMNNAETDSRDINHDFDTKNKVFVHASQIINTRYTVQIETKRIDENGNTVTNVYSSKINVMIDKQKPIVYEDELLIEQENDWVNHPKKATVLVSDQAGSGVYGYYVTNIGNACSTSKTDYTESDVNSFTTEQYKGTYYACVMDKAGNVSDGFTFKIIKTDINAPIISKFEELEADSYGNTNYYRSVKLMNRSSDSKTNDESGIERYSYCISTSEEGCDPRQEKLLDANGSASFEFEDNDVKQRICITATDKAGNISDVHCSEPYWVKKNINMGDACTICDATNNYCNNGIYVRYGNYLFTLYKNSTNSCYGYTQTNMEMPLINVGCCDSGKCHSQYVYNPSVGIYSNLKTPYNGLPSNRLSYLNEENYTFGFVTASDFTAGQNTPAVGETIHKINEFSLKNFPDTVYQGYSYGLPSENLSNVTCMIRRGNGAEAEYKRIETDSFQKTGNYHVTCTRPKGETTDEFGITKQEVETIEKDFYVDENPDYADTNPNIVDAGTQYKIKYMDYHTQTSLRARYGLLNIEEYQSIRNKSYARNLSTLLSTVVNGVVYSPGSDAAHTYGHDGVFSDISAIYATSNAYVAVTPMNYGRRAAAMSVPFNRNIKIVSGDGTQSDPFILG